jgi:L-ascorbate metabolism protein UlaG (beta-lactamase superfamily)
VELTKHAHATVVLTKAQSSIVIDPGTFTPNAAELVKSSAAVLVTHEHADHFDMPIIVAALEAQPDLRVYAPTSVTRLIGIRDNRVVTVKSGDSFEVAGFNVSVFGENHARVHADIPLGDNVGFLIDGVVYHPGDGYFVPGVPVETLLMPVSGPWEITELGIDYIRSVQPVRTVQIHDMLLNETGKSVATDYLGADSLTGVPMIRLELGETMVL